MSSLSEALKTDTRFHPGIIGVILVLSLLGIAGLVSYMEGYRYLDAFYACFITFSLVGFGDINIYVSICLKLLWLCTYLLIYKSFGRITGLTHIFIILSNTLIDRTGLIV